MYVNLTFVTISFVLAGILELRSMCVCTMSHIITNLVSLIYLDI